MKRQTVCSIRNRMTFKLAVKLGQVKAKFCNFLSFTSTFQQVLQLVFILIIIVFDLFNHQFICFTSLLVIISFLIPCIKWYPRINEHGIVVCIRVLDPFLKMHKKIFINDLSLKLRKWHIF